MKYPENYHKKFDKRRISFYGIVIPNWSKYSIYYINLDCVFKADSNYLLSIYSPQKSKKLKTEH